MSKITERLDDLERFATQVMDILARRDTVSTGLIPVTMAMPIRSPQGVIAAAGERVGVKLDSVRVMIPHGVGGATGTTLILEGGLTLFVREELAGSPPTAEATEEKPDGQVRGGDQSEVSDAGDERRIHVFGARDANERPGAVAGRD